MPLGHEDSQSYRRGVILGLTLAELLLLLLFLFLLLMSSILHRREQAREELQAEYDRAEQERRAFREALASDIARSLGEAVADDFAVLLTPQELSEPLARIGELSADNRHVRAALAAAQSELSALRDTQPPSQRDASLLREENAALRAQAEALESLLGDPDQLANMAQAIDSERAPREILEASLASYADMGSEERALPDALAQCQAGRANLGSQLNYLRAQCGREGDLPPCVYKDDGSIAYLYSVYISSAGITVQSGDQGQFRSLSWVSSLPDPRLDTPISVAEFLSATQPHFATSRTQNPECRFFVRIHDVGDTTRDQFLDQYVGVQRHFYHLLLRDR